MTVVAPIPDQTDRLINELRTAAGQASGRSMYVTVSGEHLRAAFARLDHLTDLAANPPAPAVAEPAWQIPLASVLPVIDDILQDERYIDLIGCNLIDALVAWGARNEATVDPAALAAVQRALAGG